MTAFERNRNAWDRMGAELREALSVAEEVVEENEQLREQLRQLQVCARKYLRWSDSGAFRDSVGLRPGTSPMGEDLRNLLGDPTEHKSYKGWII